MSPKLLRSLLVLSLLATGPACDDAGDPEAEDGEELPVGELGPDDGKADGSWGYATTCKAIPVVTPLVDPYIVVSIDGQTLHLRDRAGDYDRVFPVGVGAIDTVAASLTYSESHTMYPLLATGRSDFTIDTTTRASFDPCRIWWTDPATGENLPVFAGLPFMRWSGAYAIHGPITNYRAANGGRLDRGYVSHGCVRMEAADVVEVYGRIRATARVPVHVQREAERDAGHARVDVEATWIGAECADAGDCTFAGAECRHNPYSGRGFCTLPCTRYCPDKTGYPTSFCVADPDGGSGICVLKATAQNYRCRPQDHFAPLLQGRFGQPSVTATVCLPGSRGWIGDRCFGDFDCQSGNRCAGAADGQAGICTQRCSRYCPDQEGSPSTFCVAEADLGGATCVRQCTLSTNASECPAESVCVERGRNGSPTVRRTVCLPE